MIHFKQIISFILCWGIAVYKNKIIILHKLRCVTWISRDTSYLNASTTKTKKKIALLDILFIL